MRNLRRQFNALIPKSPLLVATVQALNADGTVTVTLPGGGTLRVQGEGVSISDNVFVRNSRIEGTAPALSVVQVTI